MLRGADLVQDVVLPDGDEAIEAAERRAAIDDLDAGRTRGSHEFGEFAGSPVEQQLATWLRALVDQYHVGPEAGGRGRGVQPGEAAARDQHVGVAAAVLGSPLALGLEAAQLAEPGGVAEDLLVQRPQPARADERLVVEAGRRQPAAEDVGGAHRVELERGAGVDMRDRDAVAHRLGARPHARVAVDRADAVRALSRGAHQAAAPVVLEGAAEGTPAGRIQGRGDRVARVGGHLLAVEGERERPRAIDPLAGLRVEAAHGSDTDFTSLVVVSRSAMNHARQPER